MSSSYTPILIDVNKDSETWEVSVPEMPSAECYLPETAATTYYIGDEDEEARKTGNGLHRWQQPKWLHYYVGQFFQDCMHGEGSYQWYRNYRKLPDEPHISYEGHFYANDLEGYGHLSFTEGSSFEGLFKQNHMFGPGILTDADGRQSVGFWSGRSFTRMCDTLLGVPQLAKSPCGKAKLLRFKRLMDIDEVTSTVDFALDVMKKIGAPRRVVERRDRLYNPDIRDRRSVFFNAPAFKEACCAGRPTPCDPSSDIFVEVDMDESRKSCEKEVQVVFKNEEMPEDTTSSEGLVDKALKKTVHHQKQVSRLNDSNTLVPVRNLKQVKATHLVAWNNEDRMMDMLMHVFLQRHHEQMVSFDITNMLSGDRQSYKEPGVFETTNRQFLEMCAFGLDLEVYDMIAYNDVDLNVADGRGNTGLFFAVAGDHESVIRVLLSEGAHINQQNDEGVTPLTLAITRYLAVLYKVKNWEFAFLPPNSQFIGNTAPESAIKWRPRDSIRTLFCDENEADEVDDDDLLQKYLQELEKLKGKKGKKKKKKNAEILVPPRRQFVLSLAPLPPLPPPQKPPKSKSRSSSPGKKKKKVEEPVEPVDPDLLDEREQAKLKHIEATIILLLSLGARVNMGNVPLTPLALALFTKNVDLAHRLLLLGANPNGEVYAYGGGITPLHIATLMKPCEEMVEMTRLLLDGGSDPTAVTQPYYDQPTKEFVLGGRKISKRDDVGRTPLHALVLRPDANQDQEKHLTNVLELLLQDGTSNWKRYLHHTSLALAIIRGNADLVEHMLESRLVDPNETMAGGLGTALTVLASNKCKKQVSLPDSKRMCDALVRYGADPLKVLSLDRGTFRGNVVDFANKEVEEAMKFIKSQKKLNKAAKKLLMDEYKELKALTTHIEQKAAQLLQRHVQSEFTQLFYKQLKIGGFFEPQEDSPKYLKRRPRGLKVAREWLNKEDLVRCLALLGNTGKMSVTRDEAMTMLTMLEMRSSSSGRRMKIASMEKDINTYLAPFLKPEPRSERESLIRARWQIKRHSSLVKKEERPASISQANELTLPDVEATTVDLVQSPFMTHPEVDNDDFKFEACFECGRKVGRLLQYCPNCKVVAFCSVKCNEENIKRGTVHKCGIMFYGDPAYQSFGLTIMGTWQYGSDEELSTMGESEFSGESSSDIDIKASKTSGATKTSKMSGASKRSKASGRSLQTMGEGGLPQVGSAVSKWYAEEVDFLDAGDAASEHESDEYGGAKRKSKGSKYTMSHDGSGEEMFSMKRRGDSYVKKSRFSLEEQSQTDTESIITTKGKKKKKQTNDEDDLEEDDFLGKRLRKKDKARSKEKVQRAKEVEDDGDERVKTSGKGKKSKREESEDEIGGKAESKGRKVKKATSDVEDLGGDETGAKKAKVDKGKKSKREESEDEIGGKAESKSRKVKKATSDVEDLGGDATGAKKAKVDKEKKSKREESEDEIGGKAESKGRKVKKATSDVEDLGGDATGAKKAKVDKGKKSKREESEDEIGGKAESKGRKVKKATSDVEDLGGDATGAKKAKVDKGKKSKREESEDEIGGKAESKGRKVKKATSDVEDLGGDATGAKKAKVDKGKKSKREESEDEIGGKAESKGRKVKKATSDVEDLGGDERGAKKAKVDKGKKSKREESEDEIGGKAESKSRKVKKAMSDVEELGGVKKGEGKGKTDKVKKGKYDDEKGIKAEPKGRKEKKGKSEIEDVDREKKGLKKGDTKEGKGQVKVEKKKKEKTDGINNKPFGKGTAKIEKAVKEKTVKGKEGAEKVGKHKVEDKKAIAAKGGEKEGLRSKSKADKRADQNKALDKGLKAETIARKVARGKSKETPLGRDDELKTIAVAQAQKREEEKLKFIDKYGREVTMARIGSRGEPIKEKVKLFPEHLRVYLLQACSNLGLDLDNLMLPYTVLRDGQLYYRLYGPEPVFTENYSLI